MSIEDANDQELLHAFVYGLRNKVRAEVCLRNPKTLEEAARLALDFDELLRPARNEQKIGWRQYADHGWQQPGTRSQHAGQTGGAQPMELGAV